MPQLLRLDSSADLQRSRSRAITTTFADAWTARGNGFTVVQRDLHRNPLPHLVDSELHWPSADRRADAEPPSDAQSLQRELLDELLAADVLIVGAPLYNYSLPSTLKAWVDNIHVPGVTFGPDTQPLAGRPAVVVSSRGGSYDAGTPTEGWDHGVPVLQIVLGAALGMDVTVIQTSLTLADRLPELADQRDRSAAELAAAHRAAAEWATKL